MSTKKKSFITYLSWYNSIKDLSDSDLGKLWRLLFLYVDGENPKIENSTIKMAFSFIKDFLDRDKEKYDNICNRNKTNGLKGGRPKNPKEPKKPNGLSGNPNKPKKPDNDNDNDNVNDNVKDKNTKKKTSPPDYDEFEKYAIQKSEENNINLDLQKLKLKYEAWKVAGWVSGKGTRIKNWKSTLLNTLKYLEKEKSSGKKEKEYTPFSMGAIDYKNSKF